MQQGSYSGAEFIPLTLNIHLLLPPSHRKYLYNNNIKKNLFRIPRRRPISDELVIQT